MTRMQTARDLLRHTLATLAYRGGKVVREAPDGFASLSLHPSTRTPLQILAHINDLLDWSLRMASGEYRWTTSTPQPWDDEVTRFFATLEQLDQRLAAEEPLVEKEERIFQGPIADALTHVGQIALLRRIGGLPVKGENYVKADIAPGRVGAEQQKPKAEFD